ncbi:MAG: hypothetical protein ACK4MD_09980 [Demequina sp.]
MDEFGDRLRSAADAQARRTLDARPPRELRTSVARARALRLGGSAAIAVVALAGIGAAGAGFTGFGEPVEPSPSASVDLSIEDGTIAYATVPFPDDPYERFLDDDVRWCGGPPPVTEADGADIEVTFEMPLEFDVDPASGTGSLGGTGATATTSLVGTGELPVFVERPRAFFIRDGAVVGWTPPHDRAIVTTLTPVRVVSHPWEWFGGVIACESGDAYGQLEPGEYEVVLVTKVRNDESAAALQSLWTQGYTLPPRADAQAYREGGYECTVARDLLGAVPLTCNPHALPGVDIDEEAQVATVPYVASYYQRDVDLTFASHPIPFTLYPDPYRPDLTDTVEFPSDDSATVPECGAVYAVGMDPLLIGTWDYTKSDMRSIDAGDTLRPTLWRNAMWRDASGWSSLDVELPQSARLWLLRWALSESDAGTALYEGQKVVGWIDAAPMNTAALTIDRYDGPAEWPLTVTDHGWCDGTGDPGPFDSVVIDEPVTITEEDGTNTTLEPLVFAY